MIAAIILIAAQCIVAFTVKEMLWSIFNPVVIIAIIVICIGFAWGIDATLFSSSKSNKDKKRPIKKSGKSLDPTVSKAKTSNSTLWIHEYSVRAAKRVLQIRTVRVVLISITFAGLSWLTLTRIVPLVSTFSGEPIRVVIAGIEGTDFSDGLGGKDLAKSICSMVEERIQASPAAGMVEVVYTYLPITDSSEARDISQRFGAVIAVWGKWFDFGGEMQLELMIKSYGELWVIDSGFLRTFATEKALAEFRESSRFLRTKQDFESQIYALACFLSLFAADELGDAESRLQYTKFVEGETAGRMGLAGEYIFAFMYSHFLTELQHFDEADRAANRMLRYLKAIEPNNCQAFSHYFGLKSFIKMKQENDRLASAYIDTALECSTVLPEVLEQQARLLYRSRSGDSLSFLAARFIEVYPESTRTIRDIGRMLLEVGRPRIGIKLFMHCDSVQKDFGSASHYYNLGALKYFEGDLDSALVFLSRSLQIDPAFIPSRVRYMVTLYCSNRIENCLAFVNRLPYNNTTEENDLWRYKCYALIRAGKWELASEALAEYIDSTESLIEREWKPKIANLDRQLKWVIDLKVHFEQTLKWKPKLETYDLGDLGCESIRL